MQVSDGVHGTDEQPAVDQVPSRFTIVPDDYHVSYASTAEDGRRLLELGGSIANCPLGRSRVRHVTTGPERKSRDAGTPCPSFGSTPAC